MRAPINRIVPFSAVDGPGNRTAIFTQGCSFACKYCHNPETITPCIGCGKCVAVCPTGALSMVSGAVVYDHTKCVMCDACIRTCEHLSCPRIRHLSPEEVMRLVKKQMPFIRGITVSGGECTLHRAFLLELSALAHAEKLTVLLDSNGGTDFSEDAELLNSVDGIMLDVKAWSDDDHIRVTGVSAATVRKNLTFLATAGKLQEVRTVVVPELMDALDTVTNTARTLSELHCADTLYKIIKFRPMGVREKYKTLCAPDDALLRRLETAARQQGLRNILLV